MQSSLLESKPQALPQVLPQPQPSRGEPRPTRGVSTTPGPLASFLRFVICGGGVGLLAALAVPLLARTMPWAAANAVVTVASTLLCTELHALFTFGTGRRPGWRRHLQSAGSATAAYVVTCAAVSLLHTVQSSPSMLWEQGVYLSASALAGIGRFLVLRLFVFAGADSQKRRATPNFRRSKAWNVPFVRVEACTG
ncbi:putative flippase GtrA [Streptomyces sp. LBL]|uniref:GtrA family protein n=1 Tax=Streptomyces sp. LBL TaxID=2940562 RepID=UPI0024741E4B|nr:GtrA family protein [Streptomyces sp. LBL]MDH6630555.1 putative flippase GtrA [Streptomyces sp. LBL]